MTQMSDDDKLNQMIELIQNNSENSDIANQQILAEQNAIENSTSENEVGFWKSLITGVSSSYNFVKQQMI